MRSNKEKEEKKIICVGCPKGCRITIEAEGDEIKEIRGFDCQKGSEYAREEYKNPTRILPTTVRVKNGQFPLVPVKTDKPIPRSSLLPSMKVIAEKEVEAPIELGGVIISDLLATGADLVATRSIDLKGG